MKIKFIFFIFIFLNLNCFAIAINNERKSNNIKKFPSPFEESYYEAFDSFMLNKQNIFLLQKALNIYTKNVDKNKNNNEISIIDKTDDSDNNDLKYDNSIGNIYLKSIIYLSKNSWSVWINDKKISNTNNLDEYNEFVVKEINQNSVKIVWTVIKSKWNYINSNNKISNDEYKYNQETNKIEFEITLSPNQTFIASHNVIIDGKYSEDLFKVKKDQIKNVESKEDINVFNDELNNIKDNNLEIEKLLKNL